ncbi:hypothetical protein GCM10018785_60620 [Streptomyces longispororuber]|uniref:Uncharacterized protein n=1 Tax=Streptomyces longispororuber TaxID=68230 RepID=A0A919A3C1_9ACTN|nr:hypothetical protein GCM10018785_60620 [Streptomyces longispororuber]
MRAGPRAAGSAAVGSVRVAVPVLVSVLGLVVVAVTGTTIGAASRGYQSVFILVVVAPGNRVRGWGSLGA